MSSFPTPCGNVGPVWASLVGGILGSTRVLEFYGVPAFLNQVGVFDILVDGVEGFSWSYGGIYEVNVNGGGLVSEVPLEPSRDVPLSVSVLNVRDLVSGLVEFTGSSGQPGLFNPLGWRPLAPLILEGDTGLAGCVRLGDVAASPAGLEPLHGKHVVSCSRPPPAPYRLEVKLGVFKFHVEADVVKLGSVTLARGGGFTLAWIPGAVTMRSDGCMEITLEHPYRDYSVSLMHVLSFYRFKGSGLFRGVSAVVEGPRGSLAISSPEVFEITAQRGSLVLRFKGELSLTLGGYVEASRLLLERSIRWDLSDVPSNPLGHVRSYRVQPVLVGFKDGVARFDVSNPTMADGVFEVKTYYPLMEARFSTMDGWVEARALRDSITIPAPRGYCGSVEVKIGRMPYRL